MAEGAVSANVAALREVLEICWLEVMILHKTQPYKNSGYSIASAEMSFEKKRLQLQRFFSSSRGERR